MNTRNLFVLIVGLLCLAQALWAADVTEFERSADDWLAAVPDAEARAFDAFYPGVANGGGCLVPSPETDPVTLVLAGGTVTVSGDDNGIPNCVIVDSSSTPAVSDAVLSNTLSRVTITFAPPVSAFYTFYGSLDTGKTSTMKLYSGNTLIETLTSSVSAHATNAIGHGFISSVLIDRVELTTSDGGSSLVGAFTGLAVGEPSLGTVVIPSYSGPDGEMVELDFACSFVSEDPNRVHNLTQDTWHYSLTAAIDTAVNDDEIVANPSIYHEIISFFGKAITLRSTDPADPNVVAATVIDATGFNAHAVTFDSGEGNDTALSGFTITGGDAMLGGFPTNAGGGIYCINSSPTVSYCFLEHNTAAYGGGLFLQNSNPVVRLCRFIAGSASYGGGLYNYQSGSPDLSDCTFVDNRVSSEGGAIYHNSSGSLTLTDCSFIDNEANSYGGGIRQNSGSMIITDSAFAGNKSITGAGGGIYNGGSATISGTTFSGNMAANSSGGGIYNSGGIMLHDSVFTNNTARYGGGVLTTTGLSTVDRCTFAGNTATEQGGGMYNSSTNNLTIRNSVFSANEATNQGGGIFNVNSSPSISHCTFNANSGSDGGAIYNFSNSSPAITNTIIKSNLPNGMATAGGSPTVNYSLIQGGFVGDGNFDADPTFVDPEGDDNALGTADDDLRLQAGSPAIDAGDTSVVPVEDNFDRDGNPRAPDAPATANTGITVLSTLFGQIAATDAGAYEFQPDVPCTPEIEGDVNCDGVVTLLDFVLLAGNYLAGT